MQKQLIIAGAIALAGLMVAFALSRGETRGDQPGDLDTPLSSDTEIAALQRKVQALESDLRLLRRELDQARDEGLGRPPGAAHATAAPGKPAIGNLMPGAPEEETREAVIDALASPDPEVRQRLRAVLQEEHERMRDERFDEHMARSKARSMERLNRLASEASLSATQVREVAGFLDTESEQLRGIFREARRDHSFGEARDQAEQLRAQTDQQVKDVLEEEQFQAYQSMRAEEGERFGRGRRGRERGR